MSNNLNYLKAEDTLHLRISDVEATETIEITPDITAEVDNNGELMGIKIFQASDFLRHFVLEMVQAKLHEFKK